jgi:hypothetical protein
VSNEEYLAAVEPYLSDLPWGVRRNLVNDLRVHLEEIPPGEDLVSRLGTPQSYAADLRAAAGLGSPRGVLAFLRARRPRNLVIALVILVIAAALTATIAWARNYQPVTTGSVSLNPIPSKEGAVGETVAQFRNGKPFQYGASIRNAGRLPIRILSVPTDPGFIYPFEVRAYFVASETNFAKPPEAFHPFTLGPGHERLIVLRGTYANCTQYVARGSVTLLTVPVRARFLFWTHTSRIALRGPLVIRMPVHPCSTE